MTITGKTDKRNKKISYSHFALVNLLRIKLFLISFVLFDLRRDAAATYIVIMVGVASRRSNNKK